MIPLIIFRVSRKKFPRLRQLATAVPKAQAVSVTAVVRARAALLGRRVPATRGSWPGYAACVRSGVHHQVRPSWMSFYARARLTARGHADGVRNLSRKVAEKVGHSHASTGYEASRGQDDRLGNCYIGICLALTADG